MRYTLGNLNGTLYNGSIPLVKFSYRGGFLEQFEQLCFDMDNVEWPIEFDFVKDVKKATHEFLLDRQTPHTRIGMVDELRKTPVKYYDLERLFRYNKGRFVSDRFWVDCEDIQN